jgi:GntR family transcriptional regulator
LPPSSKVIASKIVQDEDEIAASLNLPAASRMIKIERLRHTDQEPFALEACYLPADDFPGLERAPLGKSSLFSTLQKEYGVVISYADEEVDATAADNRVAQLLEVPRDSPVLRIRQVIHSANGKAIVYVLGFYRSERHSLFIRRFRQLSTPDIR